MSRVSAVVLCHPQSAWQLSGNEFTNDLVDSYFIGCGTSKSPHATLSEANDFFPNCASWNTALFESSVIMTVWEHLDNLIKTDYICILHSDIIMNKDPEYTWKTLIEYSNNSAAVGVTASIGLKQIVHEFDLNYNYTPNNDPMMVHAFDHNIHIWEYIRKLDSEIYDWAMDVQPILIYTHQFLCPIWMYEKLGNKLYNIASRLELRDVGFWTPHVFERLIALYLAFYSDNKQRLTTAFWHAASSGNLGPGEFTLYGPRCLRYYKIKRKIL